MENKVFKFDNSAEIYTALADKYIESEKYEDALRFLFDAYKKQPSGEILSTIAGVYSEIGLYELSNKYWIKYIDFSPENLWGDAYEEMGINYFCMDNFFLASYYFNKKISKDGFLKREELSDEIIDYLSDSVDKKSLYRVVYPYDKADFSDEFKAGRFCLSNGDFQKAIEYFDKIPQGAKEYYDALDEKSLALIIAGDLEGSIELNRKMMKENGESVSVFCNLSSIYHIKGDEDKSRYYFDKALSLPIKKSEEEYKLATCSLEKNEHNMAISYLEKLLVEKPFEPNLTYLLGLAYLNAKRYEKGKEVFQKLSTLSFDNPVYQYYLELSDKMIDAKGDSNLFPLQYEDALPKIESDKIKKRIKKYLTLEFSSMKKKLSQKEFVFDMNWAFKYGDYESCKMAGFLLTSLHDARSNRLIKDFLSDSMIADSYKGALLFTWIVNGEKGSIGIACGHFYNRIKIRKLPIEDDESASDLFLAYALLMTKLAFVEINNYDKVAFALNKVYEEFKGKEDLNVYTREEICGLILFICKFVRFKNTKDIAKFLGIKISRLESIISLFMGEKND